LRGIDDVEGYIGSEGGARVEGEVDDEARKETKSGREGKGCAAWTLDQLLRDVG